MDVRSGQTATDLKVNPYGVRSAKAEVYSDSPQRAETGRPRPVLSHVVIRQTSHLKSIVGLRSP